MGRIENVTPGEMKVATPEGVTATVHLNSQTAYRVDQQPAKLEDFKAGMMVFVRGTKSSDGSWEAEAVTSRSGPPRQGGPVTETMRGDSVAGTVKTIDGAKITLTLQDNSTQTIEVDENTSLRHRRESITLADIHPGDIVIVRGEKKDGAFLPKSLNVVDAEQLQRMRQFLGGSGPRGGAGTPPASNPPAAPAGQPPAADSKPPRDSR